MSDAAMMLITSPPLYYKQIRDLAAQVDPSQHQALVDRIRRAAPALPRDLPTFRQMQDQMQVYIAHRTSLKDTCTKEDFDTLLQQIDFKDDKTLHKIFGEVSAENKEWLLGKIAAIQDMQAVDKDSEYSQGHRIRDFISNLRFKIGSAERVAPPDRPIDRIEDLLVEKEVEWLEKQPEATQTLIWLLSWNVYKEADGGTILSQLFKPAITALQEKYPDDKKWNGNRHSYSEVVAAAKGLYDVREGIIHAAREANSFEKNRAINSHWETALRGKIDPMSGRLSIFKDFTDAEPLRENITEIAVGGAHIPVALLDRLARDPKALSQALKEAGIEEKKSRAR